MFVYAGLTWNQGSQDYTTHGDLWQLSNANGLGGTPAWTKLAPSGVPLEPNGNPNMVFDNSNNRLIIFGGSVPKGPSSNRVLVVSLGGGRTSEPVDSDRDGVSDELDNCPSTANADQKDDSLNGVGDACKNPNDLNFTAAFIKALPDGSTFAQPWPLPMDREPNLIQRLKAVVDFRVQSGLAASPLRLAQTLVDGLVNLGMITKADGPTMATAVADGINTPPIAKAGPNQTARRGSKVTLSGAASSDPDKGPAAITYLWSQTSGPTIALSRPIGVDSTFTPVVSGVYGFKLVVFDGKGNSQPATVTITVPLPGDIDLDGDVDKADLGFITSILNRPANGPNDLRDLNGDMKIDALDSRKLTLLCTRSRCATQ